MKKSAVNRRRQTGIASAFTFIELLVVLAMVALLTSVLLSVSFTTRERVLRAQCVSNLRQIGIGLNLHGAEADGIFPACNWPQQHLPDQPVTTNPWRTYIAAIVTPGTTNLTEDFRNLGLLFKTQSVPDPKKFYCPGLSHIDSGRAYDYYATVSNTWPSTPVGSGDDKVRTGYNYYPQLRTTTSYGGHIVPQFPDPPVKWTKLDPKKSIATDLVHNTATLPHRASGSVAGLNALFPDGRVVFQNARSNPQAFDPALWKEPDAVDYPGNNPANFRYIMSLWHP